MFVICFEAAQAATASTSVDVGLGYAEEEQFGAGDTQSSGPGYAFARELRTGLGTAAFADGLKADEQLFFR